MKIYLEGEGHTDFEPFQWKFEFGALVRVKGESPHATPMVVVQRHLTEEVSATGVMQEAYSGMSRGEMRIYPVEVLEEAKKDA